MDNREHAYHIDLVMRSRNLAAITRKRIEDSKKLAQTSLDYSARAHAALAQSLRLLANPVVRLEDVAPMEDRLDSSPRHLRDSRVPFPIAVQRQVRRKLIVAAVNALEDGLGEETRELSPGKYFELCDIEGEAALLLVGECWYRAHADEVLNDTEPVAPLPSHLVV